MNIGKIFFIFFCCVELLKTQLSIYIEKAFNWIALIFAVQLFHRETPSASTMDFINGLTNCLIYSLDGRQINFFDYYFLYTYEIVETKRNEKKRKETKRNEKKRKETKRNEKKRKERKETKLKNGQKKSGMAITLSYKILKYS
jgi:hypothetical protein